MSGVEAFAAAAARLWAEMLAGKAEAEHYERGGHLRPSGGGFYPGVLNQVRTHGEGAMLATAVRMARVAANGAELAGDEEFWRGFLVHGVGWQGEKPEIDIDALATWLSERRAAKGGCALAPEAVKQILTRGLDVFVTVYSHRHGEDLGACATAEDAEAARQLTAASQWDSEIDGVAKPDDPKELADLYYEIMGERCGREESFEVSAVELSGV